MAILFFADNADDEIVGTFSDTANNGTPTVLRRFDAPSGLRGLQGVFAHGSFLSMIDWPSKDIFRVPANTANGATIPSSDIFRWNMSSSVTNPLAVAVAPDGTFYVANEAADDEVIVLTPPTVNNGNATEVRKFDMPDVVTAATGMTISPDGETLYVGNQPNRKIVAFPADTENGETPAAADVHEITLPSDATSIQGVTLVDGELHIVDLGGFVSVITADTDDWGTATRSRKYNHPSGIGQIRGIAGWNGATVTLGTPVKTSGNRWQISITVSGEGTGGLAQDDVSVSAGTINDFFPAGSGHTVEVDAPTTGNGTVTVTVRAGAVRGGNAAVATSFNYVNEILPLSIESIDEQFITVGTEDYDLVIDITGNPDTAKATGHMEGFGQDWDAVNGQLHIKSEEVTRLINGVNWDIEVVKDVQTLMGQVAYNVVKAAPIFASLETIHLYRGVPINFDIVIQNIPPLLIPDSELLGLKSDLLDYGVNVKGEISTTDRFSFNSGNVTIIVPSENGGADTVYNYPYQIEIGTPPAISGVEFRAHGDYGELTFPDVTHALGYEWTLETGDDPTWNFFDSTRQIIDPGEIEMTLGHLSVTVKFPNVPGASSYEYQLVSEGNEGLWTRFTGTLANGFITTIIPNLQEDVEYTLRLRVASPWVGTPVSVTVFGGRTCYTLQVNTRDRDNQWLYIYHTGHQSGEHASRIKRLLLPTALSHPEEGGLMLDGDGNVGIIQTQSGSSGEKALYTFNKATIDSAADGSRLTQDMKNPFPSAMIASTFLRLSGVGYYDDDLYVFTRSAASSGVVDGWRGVQVFPLPTVDGATLVRSTTGNRYAPNTSNASFGSDIALTRESFWYMNTPGSRIHLVDRELLTGLGAQFDLFDSTGTAGANLRAHGIDVLGEDNVYNQADQRLNLYRVNPEVHATRHVLDFFLELPAGLSNPRFLSVSK